MSEMCTHIKKTVDVSFCSIPKMVSTAHINSYLDTFAVWTIKIGCYKNFLWLFSSVWGFKPFVGGSGSVSPLIQVQFELFFEHIDTGTANNWEAWLQKV